MENERVHQERLEIGDAFGGILLQCHGAGGASGVAYELIERSDGWLRAMDASRYFVDASDWTLTSRAACDRATGRVLDIGTGAGRAALFLQNEGYDVVALDVSEGASTVCQERGVRTVFTGTVFELAATRPDPFDTFVMLGNNLGLLGGLDAAPPFLDALASMARPGARVIGETLNPYQTTDPLHLEYHEANRRAGRMGGQLRLRTRHQRTATPWWDYLFCTPEELETVIAPTPWRLVDMYAPGAAGPSGSWPPGQWVGTLELVSG